MSTGTNPLSELDAVNIMLGAIFESPVNSLDTAGVEDVAIAKRMLSQKVREVLIKGLANNVEREVLLQPDAISKKIPLPNNVLFVDSEDPTAADVVQRGLFLYNRKNHTFLFTAPVSCQVIYNLEWDDLPEYVKMPIAVLAARRFQKHTFEADNKGGFDAHDEADARATLGTADAEAEGANMFSDSWSVASILDRHSDNLIIY